MPRSWGSSHLLHIAAVLCLAAPLLAAPLSALPAQVRPPTTRDSLARDSLARDSLSTDLELLAREALAYLDSLDRLDSLQLLEPLSPVRRHSVTLQGIVRRYQVGAPSVSEASAPVTWRYNGSRVGVRMSGAPLRLTADPDLVTGSAPIRARIDWMRRPGDTISVYGRSPSSPAVLDSMGLVALSQVGTSTLDVEALGLGLTSMIGTRAAFAFPVGAVVFGVSGAVEVEPRPSGAEAVFWRGNTVRAGASLYGNAGAGRWRAGAEYSHSTGDSLGGANLFQGGGLVLLDASLDAPLGATRRAFGSLTAFHLRPTNVERANQPNRLIPIGDLSGVTGLLYLPVRGVAVSPMITLMRETSTADAVEGSFRYRLNGSGWSATVGSAVDIPVIGGVTLSPEVGYVTGSVGARFSQSIALRPGLGQRVTRFDDPISGWYSGVSLNVRW